MIFFFTKSKCKLVLHWPGIKYWNFVEKISCHSDKDIRLSITVSNVGSYTFKCTNPLLGKKSLWIFNYLDLRSASIDVFRKGTYLVLTRTISSIYILFGRHGRKITHSFI